MAGVNDKDLIRLGRFPDGLNNTADPKAFPRDDNGAITALAQAVNVDLDDTARIRRARGFTVMAEGEAHSLHERKEHLLAIVNGNLCAFADHQDGLMLDKVLAGGFNRFVTYATDDDENTYWSDGLRHGRIDANLGLHPFWPGTPDPVVVATADAGALAAGTYQVSVTAIDAEGRQSGASEPVFVPVTSGQGLEVTLPAAPEGTASWRVYVSAPDGDVLYLAEELPLTAAGTLIGHGDRGAKLETADMIPLLPCWKLVYAHNRLFGLTLDHLLVWSQPYRLGLMHPENYLRLGQAATLLEAVGEGSDGAGLFVADHKRTYWLAGADPETWRQIGKRASAAVPGASTIAPASAFKLELDSDVAFWIDAKGSMCLGLPGGSVVPLREGEVALPFDAERGAACFFGFEGVQQIVTSLLGGATNPMAFSDRTEATIRRNGVVT